MLNVTVTDAEGRTICAVENLADQHYCPFLPEADGTFTVTVANGGPRADVFTLLTN